MSSSQQLYSQISQQLEQFHGQLHRRRLANWIWIVVGMILAKSVHLSLIANHLPDTTDVVAQIAKVRRWLKNPGSLGLAWAPLDVGVALQTRMVQNRNMTRAYVERAI